MDKELLKIAANGQWSLEKANPKKHTQDSPIKQDNDASLKTKMFNDKHPTILKIKAISAKKEAIKQLKEKHPDIDWDEKLAASIAELRSLIKVYR